jgi:hypothetical protein
MGLAYFSAAGRGFESYRGRSVALTRVLPAPSLCARREKSSGAVIPSHLDEISTE